MRYRHVTYRQRRNGSYDRLSTGPAAANRGPWAAAVVIVASCLSLFNTVAHHVVVTMLVVAGIVAWITLVAKVRSSKKAKRR